jgi:adenine-specific DNA-methyltransferase
MNNFHEILINQLAKESSFVTDDGELKKFIIIDAAFNMNRKLIELLLEVPEIKQKFFTEISGHWVFDINLFVQYMENKNFLKDSYTRYRNKIGLNIGGKFLNQRNEVSLVWPFKDCILEGGQSREDQKRPEIFFNEILAQEEIDQLTEPKVLTNWKRYTTDGEKLVTDLKRANGTIKENLIIKGNNLLVLHSLLPQFEGKVKLIYIDPPYNTGNDSFKYNDSFNHSTWLTFMKNRLAIALKLMRKDGVILVHCDYVEDCYLKVLMDEIFLRENYINNIAIRDSHASGLKLSAKEKTIIKTKSTILIYKKKEIISINPVYQQRNEWDTHFNTFVDIDDECLPKYSLLEYLKSKNICDDDFVLDDNSLRNKKFKDFAFKNRNKIFQSTKEIPEDGKKLSLSNRDSVVKYAENEFAFNGRRLSPLSKSIFNVGYDTYFREEFGKLLCDFWDDVDFNNSQNEGSVSFPAGKKPEFLLARLITMFTNKDDIILDYHLGSGTTATTAHKMNRQYIGIEQMDYIETVTVERLRKVIGSKVPLEKGEIVQTQLELVAEKESDYFKCVYDEGGISKAVNWQGGGEFVYCELKKYNQTFIEQIEEANSTIRLLEIWEEMKVHSFLNYNVDIKKHDESIEDFKKLDIKIQKEHLLELLNKNQLYVNLSSIDDEDYQVSENDKRLTRDFYEIKEEKEVVQTKIAHG